MSRKPLDRMGKEIRVEGGRRAMSKPRLVRENLCDEKVESRKHTREEYGPDGSRNGSSDGMK